MPVSGASLSILTPDTPGVEGKGVSRGMRMVAGRTSLPSESTRGCTSGWLPRLRYQARTRNPQMPITTSFFCSLESKTYMQKKKMDVFMIMIFLVCTKGVLVACGRCIMDAIACTATPSE